MTVTLITQVEVAIERINMEGLDLLRKVEFTAQQAGKVYSYAFTFIGTQILDRINGYWTFKYEDEVPEVERWYCSLNVTLNLLSGISRYLPWPSELRPDAPEFQARRKAVLN